MNKPASQNTPDPLDILDSETQVLTVCSAAVTAMARTAEKLRQQNGNATPQMSQQAAQAVTGLNAAIQMFDQQAKPFVDTIEAVYKLRLQGPDVVIGVMNEIKADRLAEQDIAAREQALGALEAQAETVKKEIDTLASDPGNHRWRGHGGLKKKAVQDIAERTALLDRMNAQAIDADAALKRVKVPGAKPPGNYGQFAKEKEKLRELLDLPEEEHRQRQKKLVDAAKDFVASTDRRIEDLDRAFRDAAEAEKQRASEAARIAAESADWQDQGCPTTAPVTVMRPLKIRHASFMSLSLPR
jgi:hypothetical protein